jgi:hypothetical protein
VIACIVLASVGIVYIAAASQTIVVRWPVIAAVFVGMQVSIGLGFSEFEVVVVVQRDKKWLAVLLRVAGEIGVISIFHTLWKIASG